MDAIQKRLLLLILTLLPFLVYLEQKLRIRNTIAKSSINILKQSNNENKSGFSEPPFVLSYSLFGNNWDRYGSAVDSVAASAAESSFYRNWSVRLYHDGKMMHKDLANVFKKKYKNLYFYDVSFLPEYGNVSYINGRAWRFLAAGDDNVEIMCSRDLDSPILEREENSVKEWLNSGKIFHVMRDHPMHGVVILGGTWCFKNGNNQSLGKVITKLVLEKSKSHNEAPPDDDQTVLENYIWPLIKNDVLQHDSYLCSTYNGSEPFPSKRKNRKLFIGMIGKLVDNKSNLPACPKECRPKQHQDWEYC